MFFFNFNSQPIWGLIISSINIQLMTNSESFLQFKPCKRFCALQLDFSLPFDNFNNHFGNYVWPILGL
jgi:hypothetical protein